MKIPLKHRSRAIGLTALGVLAFFGWGAARVAPAAEFFTAASAQSLPAMRSPLESEARDAASITTVPDVLPGSTTEDPPNGEDYEWQPEAGDADDEGFIIVRKEQLDSATDTASNFELESTNDSSSHMDGDDWLNKVRVGYDGGFVVASQEQLDLGAGQYPFRMRINGWGQLRHTLQDSGGSNLDVNQFQLKRGRLVFSGSSFTSDFSYFIQIDGRSSTGDDLRLLDYFLTYDLGHHVLGYERGVFGFKTGKYKMPFTMARYLSGREFEFSDRSMSSMYFDVNRSFAWGLYGEPSGSRIPWDWEAAIFNGLVTGGAETGSAGTLDNNFAYSARIMAYPQGDWGTGELADFEWHSRMATRMGAGFANSKIDRTGDTEFNSLRVVDSGSRLSSLLPDDVDSYKVNIYSIDASCKFRGWSATIEYYFRNVDGFEGVSLPDLFDHGLWLQLGKFVVPRRLQLLTRWSRIVGSSGTLGDNDQSSDEVAGGFVWYFRDQHAKFTFDATHLNGASINSSALDISPGDTGWLFRSQIQFAF